MVSISSSRAQEEYWDIHITVVTKYCTIWLLPLCSSKDREGRAIWGDSRSRTRWDRKAEYSRQSVARKCRTHNRIDGNGGRLSSPPLPIQQNILPHRQPCVRRRTERATQLIGMLCSTSWLAKITYNRRQCAKVLRKQMDRDLILYL